MADLLAIVTELGSVLATAGVNVYPVLPDVADFPCAVIQPIENVNYLTTMGSRSDIELTVTVYAKSVNSSSAWALLYALLSFNIADPSPTTIVDALVNYRGFVHFNNLDLNNASNFSVTGADSNTVSAELNLTITSQ